MAKIAFVNPHTLFQLPDPVALPTALAEISTPSGIAMTQTMPLCAAFAVAPWARSARQVLRPSGAACRRRQTNPHRPRSCATSIASQQSAEALLHAAAARTSISSEQLVTLERLCDLLLEHNRQYNLTAIRARDAVVRKHVVDALTLLPLLDDEAPERVVDVGAGAGFPGLVLAVARPTWHVTLVDSVRKKTRFQELACAELGVQNVEPVWARAETVGRDAEFREVFDVAVARSLADMRVLAELCLPLVAVDGCLVAQKSVGPGQMEVRAARRAIEILGGELEGVESAWGEGWADDGDEVDEDGRRKSLVVVRKRVETPMKYPRQAGTPKKAPL